MNTYLNFKLYSLDTNLTVYWEPKEHLVKLASSLRKAVVDYDYQTMYLKDNTNLETCLIKLDDDEFIQFNMRRELREARLYVFLRGTDYTSVAQSVQDFIEEYLKPERIKLQVRYSYN